MDSEIIDYALCLGNALRDFTVGNVKKKKNRIKRVVKIFCVNFNSIDTNAILDIPKYLMRST